MEWIKTLYLGPLTTKKRLDELEDLVEITKKEGAKILYGGKKPAGFNKGFFLNQQYLIM